MIVHPNGVKLAQARGSDESCWAKPRPDPIRTVARAARASSGSPIEDRNLNAYEGILTAGKCAFEPARRIPYRR